jgi:hypothetical protein
MRVSITTVRFVRNHFGYDDMNGSKKSLNMGSNNKAIPLPPSICWV